ncbi:MAG: Trm112 family protein [Mariprofundales bacterium]|nr:Trm112 family protein [Mariprofundales bacterium]
MIDQELLKILACPKCKQPVHYNTAKDGLVCDTCQLSYPIRDDIPVMLIDQAEPISE